MDDPKPADEPPQTLSIDRLRQAFARMLGPEAGETPAVTPPGEEVATPEGIVEALLFVGRQDDRPLTAEQIAATMRDVSADEVEAIVDRLDAGWRQQGAACRVQRSPEGLRLVIDPELERVGDRLRGRVRAAKLSTSDLEALSVIAYRQPIAAAEVDELRGAASGSTLARLAKLGLLRQDPPKAEGAPPTFMTTDRLLRTLGIASLEQLPRLAELDD